MTGSERREPRGELDRPHISSAFSPMPDRWQPGVAIPVEPTPPIYKSSKRALDVAVSGVLLLLLGLPMALLCAYIRLESPGPALFRQGRVGLGGREFTCFKLRTMSASHDPDSHRAYLEHLIVNGNVVATHMPAREITRSGRVLRKLSLDELPQLINVFQGDMSLVGPRPPIGYEVAHYKPWHLRRLSVKPGMTGYWQVNGRGRVTFDDMCRLDIEYIAKRSLWMDLKILFMTPLAALRGSG